MLGPTFPGDRACLVHVRRGSDWVLLPSCSQEGVTGLRSRGTPGLGPLVIDSRISLFLSPCPGEAPGVAFPPAEGSRDGGRQVARLVLRSIGALDDGAIS